MLLLVGQIISKFHKNLSLGDTSTKIGTNDLQSIHFQKSTISSMKFKMAAIFQDGGQIKTGKRYVLKRKYNKHNAFMV